jgi:hypothetical protein
VIHPWLLLFLHGGSPEREEIRQEVFPDITSTSYHVTDRYLDAHDIENYYHGRVVDPKASYSYPKASLEEHLTPSFSEFRRTASVIAVMRESSEEQRWTRASDIRQAVCDNGEICL